MKDTSTLQIMITVRLVMPRCSMMLTPCLRICGFVMETVSYLPPSSRRHTFTGSQAVILRTHLETPHLCWESRYDDPKELDLKVCRQINIPVFMNMRCVCRE